MSLYIVQHGKSLSKELDPEQGLSEEGISDVKRIAEVAKGYNVQVSLILHSTKKRACETAKHIAFYLSPPYGIKVSEGLKPMDDVKSIAKTIDPRENIMIVGHLPFLEKLTSFLVIGKTEIPIFKLQNGGILCIDHVADTGKWIIKWAIMPNIN